MSIELDAFVIKFVYSANLGISAINKAELKNAIGRGLLPSIVSATFPPTHPPIARPSSVSPITDVHVKTDAPKIGATMREEINSTTMIEKPAKNEFTT